MQSVVLVVCDDGKGNVSQGSGFFVRTGEILTNYHVIANHVRGKVKVAVEDRKAKEWWIRRVLYFDTKNDLALLSIFDTPKPIDLSKADFSKPVKVKKRQKFEPIVGSVGGEDFTEGDLPQPLKLATTNANAIGQAVFVLSNPEGLSGTLSKGIVSSAARKVKDIKMMQIDAPVSQGSSGGAVLNAYGEVLGIVEGSLSTGQNLNFAIPQTSIKSFLRLYDLIAEEMIFTSNSTPNGWENWSPGVLRLPRNPTSVFNTGKGSGVGKIKP